MPAPRSAAKMGRQSASRLSRDPPPRADTMDLQQLFEQGGPLMWAILAAAVVGVFFFLERLYTLSRAKVLPRTFVDRVRAKVVGGKIAEALLLCEENKSSIARMMAGGLRAYQRGKGRADIKEAVEEVGAREIAHLDRFVEVVGTMASVTPLLGLLGTVVGMIQVFQRFAEAYATGNATPDVFAKGIWIALITTAYGLMVAIPLLIAYKTLQGRNDRLIAEMEEDAMGLVDLLEDASGAATDASSEGAGEKA